MIVSVVNMKTIFTAEEAERQFRDVMEAVIRGGTVTIVKNAREFVLTEKPWVAPPGYFDGCDTPEEISEQNEFAKHSVIAVPHDLE